jgi:SAM-dependent methyltransferase
VSSVNSIFYWSDVRQGIAEIYRVLEQGGKAVLTYTCQEDLEKRRFTRHGIKTYDEQEIRLVMAGAGFRAIETIRDRDRHREFICMTGLKPVIRSTP